MTEINKAEAELVDLLKNASGMKKNTKKVKVKKTKPKRDPAFRNF